MKKRILLITALLYTMTAWATDYNVGTNDELRAAIQNDGANITVTADIELSNSTLSIENNRTVTIDLGGHTLNRGLTSREWNTGGQVITVRNGATLNLSNGTLTIDGGTITISGGYVYAQGSYGGAGIGGGESGDGATVNIIGGTVIAKAGKDDIGYRAIGPGKGSDNYGSLDIGDLMMVRAERIAAAVERHDMCWYRTQVRLEPCTHPGYTADTCPYHKH